MRQKAGFRWLIKMAWRDARSSAPRLMLFMASIVLGIAAVVAIQSFGINVEDNISRQSKAMMGADFIIDSNHPPNEKVKAIMDSLGGAEAREIKFTSMVSFPGGGSKLVQIRGVEGNFPFYGILETEPARAAENYQQENTALVDATLMLQFRLQSGDSIKVGDIYLPIGGKLISVPGQSSISASLAPQVFIPFKVLDATGLVQTGSRLDYQYFFRADADTDLEKLDEKLDPVLDAEGADLDTHTSTGRRMGNSYQNFGKFLNLVAFIALILGCIGIASSISIYIREKLTTVAVLRCTGASRMQTFGIFLLQIASMGLLSAIAGTALGILIQQLFPLLLQQFLPIEVEVSLAWEAISMGILLGISMSVMFALLPLMSIWKVSPLEALRISDKSRQSSLKVRLLILGCIFLMILLFSLWLLEDWIYAISFTGGLIVAFLLLAGMAFLLMSVLKKHFPSSWGFSARQSLLNLFRPQNQTLTLLVSIGMGTFLISTLYLTKDFLLEQLSLDSSGNVANMILFDVQTRQKENVKKMLNDEGLAIIEDIPIVSMRVQSLKGIPVNRLRKDTTHEIRNWILNHEFRVTYRDSLIASETIVEGEWSGIHSEEETLFISISENFAEDAQIELGDKLSFNVQGVILDAEVGSIRAVDWARPQLNFSLLFPTGVLEDAPQFNVLSTKIPQRQTSADVQQKLVKEFPNISIFDLRQMLKLLEDILSRISWLISFLALFSILTGIIVLTGAVRNSKYQRMKESVLLRTLGAGRTTIFKITALEYFYLGFTGSLTGLLLSYISSFLLAHFVFETEFTPTTLPFLILLISITVLVVVIGFSNSRKIIRSAPLEILRKEV